MGRAGIFVNNLEGEMAYRSFRPAPLPPVDLQIDDEMIEALTLATKAIAVLDTMAVHIPNVNLFVSMYVRKDVYKRQEAAGVDRHGLSAGYQGAVFR